MITPQIRHLANEAKRNQTHCKRGHPLSGENLYYTSHGSRACRICKTRNRKKVELTQQKRRQRLIHSIIARMDERDLTIRQLAEIAGIRRHTLVWWLTGDINMSETKFNAVLDVLELCE